MLSLVPSMSKYFILTGQPSGQGERYARKQSLQYSVMVGGRQRTHDAKELRGRGYS